jgi:hypothetical protein
LREMITPPLLPPSPFAKPVLTTVESFPSKCWILTLFLMNTQVVMATKFS